MGTELAKIDASTFLALADTSAVEALRENLAGQAITEFDLPQIKVPAGGGTAWEVPTLEGTQHEKTIEGIIVLASSRRSYWQHADITGTPPDCQSRDMVRGVGNPGGECAACQLNQFGSAERGEGKACKETRALFVLRSDALLPCVLSVPPSSLGTLKKYMLSLANSGIPHHQAVTRMTLSKQQNAAGIGYSAIDFTFAGRVGGDTQPKLIEYRDSLRKTFGG